MHRLKLIIILLFSFHMAKGENLVENGSFIFTTESHTPLGEEYISSDHTTGLKVAFDDFALIINETSTECFTNAETIFDAAGFHFFGIEPFTPESMEGTLDDGIACFLDACEDADHVEIIKIDPFEIYEIEICDIYCIPSNQTSSISATEQEEIASNVISIASAYAPICESTGMPKEIVDIDFYLDIIPGEPGLDFIGAYVKFACCSNCDAEASPDFTVDSQCNGPNSAWQAVYEGQEYQGIEHKWELYKTPFYGATSNGTLVSTQQGSSSGKFWWLNKGFYHYVVHTISGECIEDQVLVKEVVPMLTEPDFIFVDENGEPKEEFCIGEDVWIDGSASMLESSYSIHAYKYVNGDRLWFGTLGNFPTQVGLINISEKFANLTIPHFFKPGVKYDIVLATSNLDECRLWTPLIKSITLECCENFFDPYFGIKILLGEPNDIVIESYDFNQYENTDVQHEWYVLTPDEAPYELLHYSLGDLFFDDGHYDEYYTVVHKLTTPCGEYCYTRVFKVSEGETGNIEAPEVEEFDCSILDELKNICEITAPSNLTILENVLSWDPVPGATGYIVGSEYNGEPLPAPQCECESQISIESQVVEGTSWELPEVSEGECYYIVVQAICEEDVLSNPSEVICFNGTSGIEDRNDVFNVDNLTSSAILGSIQPNPTSDFVVFKVETTTAENINVSVIDVKGKIIHEVYLTANDSNTRIYEWNHSNTLSPGLYFVRFSDKNQFLTQKMIVK